MMSGPRERIVDCSANQWTKVLWSLNVTEEYSGTFNVAGVVINWRRYSGSPPFYTAGDHNTSNRFGAVVIGPYTDFWFLSPVDVTVIWGLTVPT